MKDKRGNKQYLEYGEQTIRLFPELYSAKEGPNGERVMARTVTFQVTDDCNLACFVAGTKILMEDFSYKNIEDIKVGDIVLAFDNDTEKNKQLKLQPTKVTHTFIRHDKVRRIVDEYGDEIITTDEHPFLDGRRQWKRAEELKSKKIYKIYNINNKNYSSKIVKIISNERLDDNYHTVYNFETELHTYIANDFAVHNCTYCYQCNKGKRRMSFETAKKFVDYLLDADESNHYINPTISPFIIIDFIGGEPFLEIDLIEKIVNYFNDQCFLRQHPWATRHRFSICSNGVLYFDPRVQEFMHKNRGNISFSVTIDGNKELHDSCRVFPDGSPSYDLAVAAAQDWMNQGNYMGSKITIAPGNVQYLSGALKHMVELGYTEINANCVYEEGWELEHAQELYKQMKIFSDYLIENNLYRDIFCSLYQENFFQPKDPRDNQNWCGGTGLMLACDPDGWIYPCLRYMESSLGDDQPPLRIGHVDRGIETLDNEKEIVKCLDCITRRSQSTDECFYCPIAEGCSWCSAYNYQVFGTADARATFICIMHRARALGNLYYFNKIHIKENEDDRMLCYVPKEWAIPIIGEEEFSKLIEDSGGKLGINPFDEEFRKAQKERESN